MVTDTLYLRPSEDIYLNPNFPALAYSIFPNTLQHGYLAVSEEVADEFATYIWVEEKSSSGSSQATLWAAFSMTAEEFSAYDNTIVGKIISGTIHIKHKYKTMHGINNYPECIGAIKVEEVEYEYKYSENTNAFLIDIPEAAINHINSYIATNRKLPNMVLRLAMSIIDSTLDSSKKTEAKIEVDQVYLELFFAPKIGIFEKVGGKQKTTTAAYQKAGGKWSEISEDEAKSILKNNTIRRG